MWHSTSSPHKYVAFCPPASSHRVMLRKGQCSALIEAHWRKQEPNHSHMPQSVLFVPMQINAVIYEYISTLDSASALREVLMHRRHVLHHNHIRLLVPIENFQHKLADSCWSTFSHRLRQRASSSV